MSNILNSGSQMIQDQRDAQVRAYLESSGEVGRQEAMAMFILSCAQMASDLNQMCRSRRLSPFPVDNLERPAAYIHQKIADEFRNSFGRSLFPEAIFIDVGATPVDNHKNFHLGSI